MSHCARAAIILLFSLGCARLQAQLNESDTARFQVRTGFSGNYQEGNATVLSMRGRLDLSIAPGSRFVYKTQNSSLYQSFFKVKADLDLYSRNYIYYKPKKTSYPFGIAYLSSNYRRKIQNRVFAGAGYTVQLWKRPGQVVKIAAGLVYEQSRFNGSRYNFSRYNGINTIHGWRATIYSGGWKSLFQNRLRLYYDAYWQPALNHPDNYRTQLDLGVDFPVWRGLSFTCLYTYTHEHVVVERVLQTDRLFTFGFAYQLRLKQSPQR